MPCSPTFFVSCSSSPSSPSSRPWADLSSDLLELLLGFQDSFFDHLRFGAVCKSWRAAAGAFLRNTRRRCAVPSLPLLTFRDPPKDGAGGADSGATADSAITRCFYSLSEDKVYRRQVPSESCDWACLGSSHGWLAMIGLSAKCSLFNPISGARVDLPSLATLTQFIRSVETREEDGETVYVYCDPFDEKAEPCPFTGQEIRDHFAYRLVLSSSPLDSDCIAIATVTEYQLLVYTRPGYDSWVQVPTDLKVFHDIIYHDSRFYALTFFGDTIAIDFNKASPGSPTVELLVPAPPEQNHLGDVLYLVALPSGEILQVIKYVDLPRRRPYKTETFDFYKLKVGNEGMEWVETDDNDIGGYCLFLGFNDSMSLPAFQVLGKYRTNCFFFTDDNVELYFKEDYGGLDFGMLYFKDDKEVIEHFCHIDARRVMPPPMWIMPSI